MYRGRIVETAPTESIFTNPQHPYTRALLNAIPVIDPQKKLYNQQLLPVVDIDINQNTGCPFLPRCSYAIERCKTLTPDLHKVDQSKEHLTACTRAPLPPYLPVFG